MKKLERLYEEHHKVPKPKGHAYSAVVHLNAGMNKSLCSEARKMLLGLAAGYAEAAIEEVRTEEDVLEDIRKAEEDEADT